MSNVTIDRACNVIINLRGLAHKTGWVVIHHAGYHPTRLFRGTGAYNCLKACYEREIEQPGIPATLPLSVTAFLNATGWQPNGQGA